MAVSNTELITNHYHIISLLQRSCTSHAIVSLRRPHDQFIYNSAILTVNSDDNNFTIDTPAESQLPLQAKPGDWLKFRIKLQGLILSFDTVIEDILEDEVSFRSYQLQLPSQVNYQQRREAFRANIGYQFKASFSAQVPETQHSINGRLTDLSLSGASIEVDSSTISTLKNDLPLTQCRLQINGENIAIADATIRAIQINEPSLDTHRLGIEFVELSPGERRNLQRWVMKFDRENRKSALSE